MKRSLIIKIMMYSLLSLVVVGLVTGGYVWYSMNKTMNAMYEPLPSVKWVDPVFEKEHEDAQSPSPTASASPSEVSSDVPSSEISVNEPSSVAAVAQDNSKPVSLLDAKTVERLRHPSLSDEDPFTILLLGVDERAWDHGRSDTMILVTVQPKKQSAVALSIPRDTRALMPNSGKYDKINHAYAFGGTSLSVEAVEHLFGIPIAYYMKTNMEGLVSIVDTLGGVDVDNERAFDYEGLSFPLGEQHLDGSQALAYSRMRKEDPHGDFGRTQRQRQILTDAVDRVTSIQSLTKLPRLLSQLSDYVRTNLTSQNMIDLALKYRPSIKNVETLYLNGQGKMINGIYYYTVTPEARQAIQKEMVKHLNAT